MSLPNRHRGRVGETKTEPEVTGQKPEKQDQEKTMNQTVDRERTRRITHIRDTSRLRPESNLGIRVVVPQYP